MPVSGNRMPMDEFYECRATDPGQPWHLKRVVRPGGFWGRGAGLLARPTLRPDEALWLEPCGGIHTWGMRYPIDVVFLDGKRRVLRIVNNLPPWRLAFAPKGTRGVLELRAGAAAGLTAGRKLQFRQGEAASER